MALTAQKFVDFLEQRGVLAPNDILSLREQVAQSKTPFHPTFIARRLVQLRYLNPYFAKTLLEEAIAQNRPVSNENLQFVDDRDGDADVDEADANKAPAAIPFDEPEAKEPEIDLSNIVLPVIQEVDLMSDEAVERAMLIPALQRSLITEKLGPFKAFDFSGLPAWQRVVIAFSITTTFILLLVLLLIILLSA